MQQYKGQLRRVDELGRVVIPKEIRAALKINAGNLLEFFCDSDKDSLILKKYEPIKQIESFANSCLSAMQQFGEYVFLLCDTTQVLCTQNISKNEYMHSTMHPYLFAKLRNQKILHNTQVLQGEVGQSNNAVLPILCRGDLWGCIVVFCNHDIEQSIIQTTKVVCTIIGEYLAE